MKHEKEKKYGFLLLGLLGCICALLLLASTTVKQISLNRQQQSTQEVQKKARVCAQENLKAALDEIQCLLGPDSRLLYPDPGLNNSQSYRIWDIESNQWIGTITNGISCNYHILDPLLEKNPCKYSPLGLLVNYKTRALKTNLCTYLENGTPLHDDAPIFTAPGGLQEQAIPKFGLLRSYYNHICNYQANPAKPIIPQPYLGACIPFNALNYVEQIQTPYRIGIGPVITSIAITFSFDPENTSFPTHYALTCTFQNFHRFPLMQHTYTLQAWEIGSHFPFCEHAFTCAFNPQSTQTVRLSGVLENHSWHPTPKLAIALTQAYSNDLYQAVFPLSVNIHSPTACSFSRTPAAYEVITKNPLAVFDYTERQIGSPISLSNWIQSHVSLNPPTIDCEPFTATLKNPAFFANAPINSFSIHPLQCIGASALPNGFPAERTFLATPQGEFQCDYAYYLNQVLWDDFCFISAKTIEDDYQAIETQGNKADRTADYYFLKNPFNIHNPHPAAWSNFLDFLTRSPYFYSTTQCQALGNRLIQTIQGRKQPFSSLSDFINRDPKASQTKGILAQALYKQRLSIGQAELLDRIGHKLTLKSDSLIITVFGKATTLQGKTVTHAIQAHLQRYPELYDPHKPELGRRWRIIHMTGAHKKGSLEAIP